jgi:predicted nucleic-acid-binding Zn-ribbon protein
MFIQLLHIYPHYFSFFKLFKFNDVHFIFAEFTNCGFSEFYRKNRAMC